MFLMIYILGCDGRLVKPDVSTGVDSNHRHSCSQLFIEPFMACHAIPRLVLATGQPTSGSVYGTVIACGIPAEPQ